MRNFRRQSGQASRVPIGGGLPRTIPTTCMCETIVIDDVDGTPSSEWSPCTGTLTAGVADCTCCNKKPKDVGMYESALTFG
jgi:hypothetical protein